MLENPNPETASGGRKTVLQHGRSRRLSYGRATRSLETDVRKGQRKDDLGEKCRCLEAILSLEPDNERAYMVLLRVIQRQQTVTNLHPANAEELANIAQETGTEVLRGALRYPRETGGWQLGDVDLGEHLEKYRDREVVLIVASVGKTDKEKVTCGICGFVMDEAGECPRCKLIVEETARDIEAKQEMREALLREVERILEEGWEHSS